MLLSRVKIYAKGNRIKEVSLILALFGYTLQILKITAGFKSLNSHEPWNNI